MPSFLVFSSEPQILVTAVSIPVPHRTNILNKATTILDQKRITNQLLLSSNYYHIAQVNTIIPHIFLSEPQILVTAVSSPIPHEKSLIKIQQQSNIRNL